jgi:uncharacterized membrane protein
MNRPLDEFLSEWCAAGLLGRDQVERILAFESRRDPAPGGRRLAGLAIGFGVLLVGAGILLFVAANWRHLGPGVRFMLVLAMVGGFHLAGALGGARRPRLAMGLHGLGTTALGAGIFLSGQIFNMQEHWPGGLLLWALGALLGWVVLRDWVQGLLAALLTPAWIMSEWAEAARQASGHAEVERVLAACSLLLAICYLTAPLPGRESPLRKALAWLGGLALIPATLMLVMSRSGWLFGSSVGIGFNTPGTPLFLAGWAMALGGPLALSALMRGRAAWMNLVATLWVLALMLLGVDWGVHLLCGLGAIGLVLWGLREARSERVNLGVAGFAITLLAFYFSSIMDKLGRSLGLIGLGLLFLAGGWQLERLRRRLNGLIGKEKA